MSEQDRVKNVATFQNGNFSVLKDNTGWFTYAGRWLQNNWVGLTTSIGVGAGCGAAVGVWAMHNPVIAVNAPATIQREGEWVIGSFRIRHPGAGRP